MRTFRRNRAPAVEKLPLEESLINEGDPALVAEMLQLKEEGYATPQDRYIATVSAEGRSKGERYVKLRENLERTHLEQLLTTLVATGFDSHASPDAPPKKIFPDRWRILTRNYEDSSASDRGMEITGILAWRPNRQAKAPAPTGISEIAIDKVSRIASFNDIEARLSGRCFDLLVVLAEEAKSRGGSPVSIRKFFRG
jgi:hypothetical protein